MFSDIIKENVTKKEDFDVKRTITDVWYHRKNLNAATDEIEKWMNAEIEEKQQNLKKSLRYNKKKLKTITEDYERIKRLAPEVDLSEKAVQEEQSFEEKIRGILTEYQNVTYMLDKVMTREMYSLFPDVMNNIRMDDDISIALGNDIREILENEITSKADKQDSLAKLFKEYLIFKVEEPMIFSGEIKAMLTDDEIQRALKAYGMFYRCIWDTMDDIRKIDDPNSIRYYAALRVRYFSQECKTGKTQKDKFSKMMHMLGDTKAEKFDKKSVENYTKRGIELFIEKFYDYYQNAVEENPDVQYCLDKFVSRPSGKRLKSCRKLLDFSEKPAQNEDILETQDKEEDDYE